MIKEEISVLEKISKFSKEKAREQIMKRVEEEIKRQEYQLYRK